MADSSWFIHFDKVFNSLRDLNQGGGASQKGHLEGGNSEVVHTYAKRVPAISKIVSMMIQRSSALGTL